MADSTSQVTRLLQAWRKGDPAAPGKLMPLVYDELRRIARRYMAREGVGHTLQATALVNEAYLRVAKQEDADWNDRLHFFAIAAQMMRRLLVDHARRRGRVKRGGSWDRVSVDERDAPSSDEGIDVLALHEALGRLATLDRRKSQLVELRYFGGLNVEETAEVLGIAPITVKREWAKAKAWLYNELQTPQRD
jgi:RNA polymerase sigma factor (TIGR02999 family)